MIKDTRWPEYITEDRYGYIMVNGKPVLIRIECILARKDK